MPRARKRSRARDGAVGDDLTMLPAHARKGDKPRSADQLTGTKALMLAVLEEGIRSYLRGSRALAHEAEFWILSQRQRSPFAFTVVCEILGLDPDAVRKALNRMKSEGVPSRKALPRARRNVRASGRMHPRSTG
jgi:hypothetical protein